MVSLGCVSVLVDEAPLWRAVGVHHFAFKGKVSELVLVWFSLVTLFEARGWSVGRSVRVRFTVVLVHSLRTQSQQYDNGSDAYLVAQSMICSCRFGTGITITV